MKSLSLLQRYVLVTVAVLSASRVLAAERDAKTLVVSPQLSSQLAKFKRVPMELEASLTPRERQMIDKLIEASRYLDIVYWQQSDAQGWQLFNELSASKAPRDVELRRYLMINGSRYDLIRKQAPFVGTVPRPPGGDIYPPDLTKEELVRYAQAHPQEKSAIYHPFTVIRREGAALKAIPYHVAYKQWLEPAAKLLREAADLADDPAFAKFLRLRADALLNDDYFESDIAWVSLDSPKFDLIFAPYETYLDDLLGVKTSYGAAILIRNDAESRKLEVFRKYEADLQDALPLPAEDKPSKKGHRSPMEVMDAPFRAGDLRHGYQAVADNLPNDPRIHEQYGSKKIFFKNYMDARVDYVILPIAKRLLREDQARLASADGYLTTTMMHEISHGLGPAFARTPQGKKDIREAIGGEYSGLEEAKADIVGLYGLKWLVDHHAIPGDQLNGYYASEVAGYLRTVRFGIAEAHGRAEIMQFNYMSERGVIEWDDSIKRYVIDFAKMPDAVAALAKELLEQEATGDAQRVSAWFAKYGSMPPQLAKALQATADVPVDIDPVQAADLHPPPSPARER